MTTDELKAIRKSILRALNSCTCPCSCPAAHTDWEDSLSDALGLIDSRIKEPAEEHDDTPA